MSVKYEVLKKLVVAAGLKKRWLSVTTEELLEDRRKQNAKNRMFHCYPVFPIVKEAKEGWDLMVRLMKEAT